MSFAFHGIGVAVPPARIDQREAARIARALCCRTEEQATWLPAMYDQTGIEGRHIALGTPLIRDLLEGTRESGSIYLPKGPDDATGPTTGQRMKIYAELSVPLAVEACDKAINQAGWDASEITHLVTVSCTGFFAPGIDYALIQRLNLSRTVQRTHVGFMGCHGAINGLRVASAYAGADPEARVLLCAVELSSVHYHYAWDPQRMIANAIFGDGAAAVCGMKPSETDSRWTTSATGSCLIPDSADAMSWTIGDHGFAMTLSKRVPDLIHRDIRAWLEPWLKSLGYRLNEIGSWAIHPGGPRVLAAVQEALDLPAEKLTAPREVFGARGNMSSPTVLFILERLRAANAPRPAVALAFGPGLVAEAALVT
jgi:predicted naringenin-chalcone synthase